MKAGEITFGVRLIQCKECDRVKVVRCKDCRHRKLTSAYQINICGAQEDSFIEVSDEFYCAYGERKEA